MATAYKLRVTNTSNAFEQFAIYQNDPDLGSSNAMSLAWFVQGAHPGQTIDFEWTIDYSVMWSANGTANGTVKFVIAQEVPCDPSDVNRNGVQLVYENGVPWLQPSRFALGIPRSGCIYVNELSTLPSSSGLIGLAIGGKPAYAAPAEPNRLEVFKPHPNYWITAGTFEAGVALDVEEISSRSQEITFDDGIYDLSVGFDRARVWSVSETAS
jgi:rhizosphere induced protein